jgi:hypothetical protein
MRILFCLLGYLWRYRARVVAAYLCLTVSVLLGEAVPWLIKESIDCGLTVRQQTFNLPVMNPNPWRRSRRHSLVRRSRSGRQPPHARQAGGLQWPDSHASNAGSPTGLNGHAHC